MKKLLKFIVPILLFTLVFTLAACKKEKIGSITLSDVLFNDTSYVYDGEEKALTIEGTLPKGLSVSYTNNTLKDVGSTLATATFSGKYKGQKVNPMTATLTITKADYDLSNINFIDTTYIYNGLEQELIIEEAIPKGTMVSYSSNTMTEPGSKEVTAKIIGDSNHNEAILKAKFTIVAAEFVLNENEYTLSKCSEDINGKLVIPELYNGKPITSLKNELFAGKENITLVTLPSSLKEIGSTVFYSCKSLTSIHIPKNVQSIGYASFYGCDNLKSITVDSENTIYDSRDNCNAIIESASNKLIAGCNISIIPESIEKIESSAIIGCNELKTIHIPANVKSILAGSFYDCPLLESITVDPNNTFYNSNNNCNAIIENETKTLIVGCKSTIIPSSVEVIAGNAFSGCIGLTTITLPDKLCSIEFQAFYGCTNLESITIPDSVTMIHAYVFYNCNSLTSITYLGTIAQWNVIMKVTNINVTIICSDGTIN